MTALILVALAFTAGLALGGRLSAPLEREFRRRLKAERYIRSFFKTGARSGPSLPVPGPNVVASCWPTLPRWYVTAKVEPFAVDLGASIKIEPQCPPLIRDLRDISQHRGDALGYSMGMDFGTPEPAVTRFALPVKKQLRVTVVQTSEGPEWVDAGYDGDPMTDEAGGVSH